MAPLRQIEAAELMCGQQNFTSSFAKAILAATPADQLSERPGQRRKVATDVAAQLVKLERELASLQAQASTISENYGIDHLHYAVATSYVSGLMNNDAVASWLAQHYPEYTAELRAAPVGRRPNERHRGLGDNSDA
jgi:RepB plasmid partitioning protein